MLAVSHQLVNPLDPISEIIWSQQTCELFAVLGFVPSSPDGDDSLSPGWLSVLRHFITLINKWENQNDETSLKPSRRIVNQTRVHRQQFTSLLRWMKTFLIVSRSWPEMCLSKILSKLGWDDRDRSIWRPKYLQVKPVYKDSEQTTTHPLTC